MKYLNLQKGIALIALVITIIILLILAGVSISLVVGENGILNKSTDATILYNEASAKEKLKLALADLAADKIINDKYNNEEYVNTYLEKQGFSVFDNKVEVDGFEFEFDRDELIILRSFADMKNKLTLNSGVSIRKNETSGDYYMNFDGSDKSYAYMNDLGQDIKWSNGYTIEFDMEWHNFDNYCRVFSFGSEENSSANRIGIGNYKTTSTLFLSVYTDTKETKYLVPDFFELNQRKKYKVDYICNENGNYDIIATNITDNLIYTVAEDTEIDIVDMDRTCNYLGYSGFNNDSKFNGKIYSLKITVDNELLIDYDVNRLYAN